MKTTFLKEYAAYNQAFKENAERHPRAHTAVTFIVAAIQMAMAWVFFSFII